MSDWIPGILELTSKVRYGITSRGLPIFRFVPYDKLLHPFAVGCSQRDLFHNVHAIVSPLSGEEGKGVLQKAILIQNLGKPTPESELQVLLATYAYDSKKSLRPTKDKEGITITLPTLTERKSIEGFTFNIDPPGCKDVDDSFTVIESEEKGKWHISINIADVSSLIQEDSPLDIQARERATSFYSPTGECLAPMFPPEISEIAASLGSDEKRAVLSLQFTYTSDNEGGQLSDFKWTEGVVSRTRSFTYDDANTLLHNYKELQIIKDISKGADSHEWVQNLMILYNKKAGEALKTTGKGILRAHSVPDAEKLSTLVAIDPAFAILAYDAATFCLSTEENTRHFGLDSDAYAYASSPIRRYCDLVNQRALKGAISQVSIDLVDSLNRRQKQAKAFSRDLFFMTELANKKDSVEGVVLNQSDLQKTRVQFVKVYVPVWKRCIKVRIQSDMRIPVPGEKVIIEWYDDREKPNWKERIIFRIH